MGLDLYLIKSKQALDRDNPVWEDDQELWYGRKTWSIKGFLEDSPETISVEDDFIQIIPKSRFVELAYRALPYAAKLDEIKAQLDAMDNYYDISEEEYRSYTGLLSRILDDCSSVLGSDWDITALIRLLDSMDKIAEAYKEGYTIYMVASY